ncbi:MAG: cytochrome c3 family protein [Candidatus Longimicrobiales bacterium M2_2A_002]
MGRVLLIGLVVALLGACDEGTPTPGDAPHADLACAACHQGPQGERGRATVPEASCTGSGCHTQGGPEEVQVATVTFPHRDHGESGDIQPTCAGCHTHETGEAPLEASVDACALCHISEVTSAEAQECRLCHAESDHDEATDQGVVVAHADLPWLEIGCVRCHYDVASPQTDVSGLKCRQCHDDMEVLNEAAVGRDLHPIHDGVTCTSCHQEDVHEVRAMSSVVQLVCSDCHAREHGVAVNDREGWSTSELCVACHEGVHSPQQRLVLGIRPDSGVTPSAKFLAGITCRSCHIPPEVRDPAQPIRGQAEACSGCHPAEYEQVLPWWKEGLRMRLTAVGQYLDRASRQVAPTSDSARALVEQAREMVVLVRQAGGQHNLELSDQLMRDAVDRIQEAYAVAGRQPPSSPDLGRAPHMGLCSYCHYESTQMWDLRDMPEDFHRTVLGEP